jgi:dihydroorotate dehydrogenase (NAD+) catalytic subunit
MPEQMPEQPVLSPLLHTRVGDICLKHPLMNASGAFNVAVANRLFSLETGLSALVSKTVTPQASVGNTQQRTVELPGIGMLNSIGLQGKGLMETLNSDIPAWQHSAPAIPKVLSISADSEAAFAAMARHIEMHPQRVQLQAIEVNVSCPNVHAGGALFGSSPEWVARALKAVAAETTLPLWVKLTPNAPDVVAVGQRAVEAGATALTAINTVLGAHVDIKRRKISLSRGSGGYSGPGIKPIAIHHVLNLKRALPDTPIIGVGGIQHAEDVLEFMMAGCHAVQIGTQFFRDPFTYLNTLDTLITWCETEGLSSLQEIVGMAHP